MSLRRVISWEHIMAVKHALNMLKSDERAIIKSLREQEKKKPQKIKLIK